MRFPRDVIDKSPDHVIVLAGVNDVYQGRSQDAIRKNLSSMYELARRNGIRTATIQPYNYASKRGSETITELNDWIRQTANQLGLSFCDTNAAVTHASEPHKLASSPDGLHPDVVGYRKMGEALASVILSSL